MFNAHHNGSEREMTPKEITEYEITVASAQAEREALEEAKAAKQLARAAALTKLGLTADEVAALFG